TGRDRDDGPGQHGRLAFRRRAVLRLTQVSAPAHLLGLPLDAVRGDDRPALGKEVVPGEPSGDLDDVAPTAHTGDVVAQKDLHASAPASSAVAPSLTDGVAPAPLSPAAPSASPAAATVSAAAWGLLGASAAAALPPDLSRRPC